MATKEDIWNGEDAKLGSEWVEQLQLKNVKKVRGAFVDGVCLGATLSVVKEVQNSDIRNEAQLIASVAKYQEGFSVEAAAMQIAYEAVAQDYRDRLHELIREENEAASLEESAIAEDKIKREFGDIEPNIRRLTKVAPLIGLELAEGKDITKKGCYCITSGHHALALLNLDFGTYVVDPNNGLSPWDATRQEQYKDFTHVYSFRNLK